MPDRPENPLAFPSVCMNDTQHPDSVSGMSLRDWFAGQALAQANREVWENHKYEDVAKRAYGIADAMLLARGEQ
jgi:hypothetical protein